MMTKEVLKQMTQSQLSQLVANFKKFQAAVEKLNIGAVCKLAIRRIKNGDEIVIFRTKIDGKAINPCFRSWHYWDYFDGYPFSIFVSTTVPIGWF